MGNSTVRSFPWLEISLNLLPLFGVLFLGWNLFAVMLVYWFEAAMILIAGMARVLWQGQSPVRHGLGMLVLSPIYLGPAAGCVAAYGIAVVTFFYASAPLTTWDQFPRLEEIGKPLVDEWLWVPIAAMLLSYVRDFAREWLWNGAYRTASLVRTMLSLYGRVILLQVVTVSVAAVVIKTGQGVLALALLVIVKVALDLALYKWRNRASAVASTTRSGATQGAAAL